MILLRIAVKNVGRNRRRSLLTGGAIFFGVFAALFLQGFVNGLTERLAKNFTEGRTGSIQIHRPGFLQADRDPLSLDMPLAPALMDRLRAIPGVLGVAPRITFDAMIGNGVQSTLANVTAIDPALELSACPDRWSNSGVKGIHGKVANGAALGAALKEALGADEGATLSLMTATREGGSNALDLTVEEVYGVSNPLESKRGVVVLLPWAQQLLGMPGRVTEYVVRAARPSDALEVAERIRAALGPSYEVVAWQQFAPQVADGLKLFQVVLAVVVVVLFALVLTSIANTMLMSVFERVREIGTMLAVGVRRRRVVTLFLAEAMVLGAAGAGLGGLAGTLLVLWLGGRGVPLRPPGTHVVMSLYPYLSAPFVAGTVLLAIAGALAAALYPAWHAAKLTPVEALRSI